MRTSGHHVGKAGVSEDGGTGEPQERDFHAGNEYAEEYQLVRYMWERRMIR